MSACDTQNHFKARHPYIVVDGPSVKQTNPFDNLCRACRALYFALVPPRKAIKQHRPLCKLCSAHTHTHTQNRAPSVIKSTKEQQFNEIVKPKNAMNLYFSSHSPHNSSECYRILQNVFATMLYVKYLINLLILFQLVYRKKRAFLPFSVLFCFRLLFVLYLALSKWNFC